MATASLDFRQSTDARFPAQIHDIKAAIRFLRAKAADYGYRTDRIAIAGTSSGGHLAALTGVTNGHRDFEGSVGDYAAFSSEAQAIVSYFGALESHDYSEAAHAFRTRGARAGPDAVARRAAGGSEWPRRIG